jgi:phosphatidate cytidylyltransferase
MDSTTKQRLFGWQHAFDMPVTSWIIAGLVGLIVIAPALIFTFQQMGRTSSQQHQELAKRYTSWVILLLVMLVPLLLGAFWMMLGVGLLSVLCYREFSHAPGMNRDRPVAGMVYLAIVLTTFAEIDHWYALFVALFPLSVGAIAAVAILADRPEGYIQRVSLGVLGYTLFGCGLGHLGFFANDANYRPIVLMILLAVELNDIFAYCCGKAFGHLKLSPRTSPNKTIGGALGALVLTTMLVAFLSHYVFFGTVLAAPGHGLALGVIIGVVGQFGDLMLSSIKRDLKIKDMGDMIPGHGGLLDRFDSILLVAPATFHYIHYFLGVGMDQPQRIFSGM